MITVKSYLKKGGEFISIADFDEKVSDPNYIEGAIELNINGVEVLTLALWDYVDVLWAYIAQGLEAITTESEYLTTFPDQPIELIFRTDARRQRIIVEATPAEGRVVASADYNEFMAAMCEAGQQFFRKMIELVPKKATSYKKQLLRIESAMPYAKH